MPPPPTVVGHPTVVRVTETLRAAGALGTPVALDEAARTAAAAAAQLGCEVGAIANSLLFRLTPSTPAAHDAPDAPNAPDAPDAPSTPLLVMTSGAHRVDTGKVAALLGAGVISRADPDFVRTHTGMAIGGVAPVGHPRPIRTLVDVDLSAHPVIWAAAGHPHAVFPTSYTELLRITGGVPAQVA